MKRLRWAACAAAVLCAQATGAPFGGSPGFVVGLEFPMESFGYQSAWPATPAAGLAYEVPAHEKLAWTFEAAYAYKVLHQKTGPGDSQYYAILTRRGDEIYDLYVDARRSGHFASFQAAPAVIAWKHFQFGFGWRLTCSYTQATGYHHYDYWYPERRQETWEIQSTPRISFHQKFFPEIGARFGPFRLMSRLHAADLGYGYNVNVYYYPWQTRPRPAP